MKNEPVEEGARWAGVKNVIKSGNLPLAAGLTAVGAATTTAFGLGPVPGALGGALGALAGGARKDIAFDYRQGKRAYNVKQKENQDIADNKRMRHELYNKAKGGLMYKDVREETENLLKSIIDQKPLDTKTSFDSIMKTNLSDYIDSYKQEYAEHLFGGKKADVDSEEKDDDADTDENDDKEEDNNDETDEEEISDKDIDAVLDDLSDEELETLITDIESDETEDAGIEDDTSESDENTTNIAENRMVDQAHSEFYIDKGRDPKDAKELKDWWAKEKAPPYKASEKSKDVETLDPNTVEPKSKGSLQPTKKLIASWNKQVKEGTE